MSQDFWQRPLVSKVKEFTFPYLYRFPGQEKDEAILFVTREAKITLYLRWLLLALVDIFLIVVVWYVGNLINSWWPSDIMSLALGITILVLIGGGLLTAYIFYLGWLKTIGIVTNFRLIKTVQFGLWHQTTQTLFSIPMTICVM